MSYFYTLEIKPLLVASCSNVVSPPIGCHFVLFMVSSAMQKLISLTRSHLFIFAFISIALWDWSKNTLLRFMSENVLSIFCSRNFMVSYLIFWLPWWLRRWKNLPAKQENWVHSLGWEDPLQKGMVLAWKIPCIKEPSGLQFMGSQRVGHNWVTNTFTFHLILTSSRHFEFIFVFGVRVCFNFTD